MKNISKFILVLLVLSSCSIFQSGSDTIEAIVSISYPAGDFEELFNVIESDDLNSKSIVINYSDYVEEHPDMRETVESDTIRVLLEEYRSEFNTPRYRLLDVLD